MSELTSAYPVHIGLWTDWSHGAVFGRTLTVTRSNGALLIAFLAFFVTLVGSQIWRILCFILHHYYSVARAADAVHNQRQAILRNSGGPLGGFLELFQLTWAWRRHHYHKILPILACAGLMACALAVASGFSSRVAMGNEVLITGDDCGLLDWNNATFSEIYHHLRPSSGREAERASNYAQRCYRENGRDSDCNTPVKRSLPVSIDNNAPCPFDDSLCLSSDGNILLDTGLLDSHTDLGINAPASARFQYRQTFHCAPLVTEGFRTYLQGPLNRTFVRYQYGPTFYDDASGCNCTFAVRNDTKEVLHKSLPEVAVPGYFLTVQEANFFNGSLLSEASTFQPVEAFGRTDIDLHIIGLAAPNIFFMSKSSDPWYRATRPRTLTTAANPDTISNITIWEAEEPMWPMGCAAQQQWCGSSASGERFCTELAGYYDVVDGVERHLAAEGENKGGGLQWIMTALGSVLYINKILSVLDAKALTSRFGMASPDMQAVLEPDQWHMDMAHLFNTSLAWVQFSLLSTAAGFELENEVTRHLAITPSSPGGQDTCRNQKIRSPEHTSFNFFGLIFILALGAAIILTSLVIEPVVAWVQTRWDLGGYARLEWRANHKLYLQRLAHEELGFGEWRNGALNVPITRAGDTLGVLDVSNPEAPRIMAPSVPASTSTHSEKRVSDEGNSVSPVESVRELEIAHEHGSRAVSPMLSDNEDIDEPVKGPAAAHHERVVDG